MTQAHARTGPLRLCVLVSGNGSNLQAVLDAIAAGTLDAMVLAVFSDKPQAPALQRARDAGIPAIALQPTGFATRGAFDAALFAAIDGQRPDLILCAGYLRLIDAAQVDSRAGRLLNIHPSLLPAFKGLHTHRQALSSGVAEHGASVHVVSAELDGGPVIAQVRVPVLQGDDACLLGRRVLAAEHRLLVATLQLLAIGRVSLHGGQIALDGEPMARPLQLGATLAFP